MSTRTAVSKGKKNSLDEPMRIAHFTQIRKSSLSYALSPKNQRKKKNHSIHRSVSKFV